jgi:hypothetical protein
MKKILALPLVLLLIMSAIGVSGGPFGTNSDNERRTCMKDLLFSSVDIQPYSEDYVVVDCDTTTIYRMNPGEPMLPKVQYHLELPFGVKHINVEVTPLNIQQQQIEKEIRPAPVPQPLTYSTDYQAPNQKKLDIYDSNELYPSAWYESSIGVGLNDENERVTHVVVDVYPLRYRPTTGIIQVAEGAEISITYEQPESDPETAKDGYDLVIIAPSVFSSALQPLVEHKNNYGVRTMLKTTEEIYSEYSGRDKPEQIKYFIKDAIDQWEITYVLLVGGLKSMLWGQARDDDNQGTKDWYLPVRYANNQYSEPGFISDLYYADVFKEGAEFDDWDSDGDGVFAEFRGMLQDRLDMYPDVNLGRLACRSEQEVETMVQKIITYESTKADPSWFKKIIAVAGDGFLDQEDLDIQWNTQGVPNGEYTLYAQSSNPEGATGPIEEISFRLDKTVETSLTFNHDDNLRVSSYPADPIAEIVSISEGDVVGNTDFSYNPTEREAYCNDHNGWARVQYQNGILHIRGKSYDPRPYGNISSIHVWITNSDGDTIFSDYRNDTKMFYESEWATGEKPLLGRGGGLYYMPEDFEREILWTSSGNWNDQQDVIDAFNQGSGFIFFSGHGSPFSWGNHYPGIPGNRRNADVDGLNVVNIDYYFPYLYTPLLPMNELSNGDKLPVVVVGGCHNSMFSVTLLSTLLDKNNNHHTHCFGVPTPEAWSWYLTRLTTGGAIACIGNTGYGFGILGEDCTTGGEDNWITTEFFKQYGTEGKEVLGDAYSQSLSEHLLAFGRSDGGNLQSVQQWVLLGDPSLQIGGYE